MKSLKVTTEYAGERLDKFLSMNFTDMNLPVLSRSQIQRMIKNGQIKINDKIVAPHYFLKENDKISIWPDPNPPKEDGTLSEQNNLNTKSKNLNIKIISNTPDYFIINKPAGLIVHESANKEKNILAELLLKKFPELKKVGEDPQRPAIVHRLDRDASGLMVIPKNQAMFDYLKKEFQARRVKKEYIALIYGQLSKDEDTISFPIDRSRDGYRMAAHPVLNKDKKNTAGKRAVTEFEVLKRFVNYTLVKLRAKTGRTHQIRVHMSAYGHPLVGDDLYGTPKTKLQNKKLNPGRIFLLAKKLSFTDMDGQMKEFEMEMPDDLNNLLTKIK